MLKQRYDSSQRVRSCRRYSRQRQLYEISAVAADSVLNEPITLPDNSEGAAFGAAVLGFISSGKLKSIADTAELVHAKKVYTPQAGNAETYKELYSIFEQLYDNLLPQFTAITAYQKKL